MLRPLAMQHVTLWMVREDAPAAALALAESGAFNPDSADGFRLGLPEVPESGYREVFQRARARLDKIRAHFGAGPARPLPDAPPAVALADLEVLDRRLGEIWNECLASEERLRRAEEERARIRQLLGTLETFTALDLDLGKLLAEHRFLDVRIGTVPAANLARLRESLRMAGFMVSSFASAEGVEHCVVAGPADRAAEASAVLYTAGWHAVDVPPELRTHPETARAQSLARLAAIEAEVAAVREAVARRGAALESEIALAEIRLQCAAPFAAMLERSLRGRGGLVLVTGWVPTRDAPGLRTLLERRLARPFMLRLRDPEPGERPRVPSAMRHPALLRGFATLVRTYGVPRYGEVDPTWLFAASFVLMFGMMFGDLGQGMVIAAAGLLLRGRFAPARPLAVACGCASALFGLLYGSVFGYEHVIPALWISPLTDPLRMLAVAVFWGIGFIVIASLIKIYNLHVERGLRAALADPGGVAGLALYLGAVAGIVGLLRGDGFGWLPAAAVTAGAATVLAHAYRAHQGPAGERLLVAGVETFEAGIGFFANTLSFMRVGAFSLNHVALAAAVFTVANMTGGAAHWLVVVLGNVLIMVLEGAIVAIQALRLEYYEGFSRFFSGDGREYHPLRLRNGDHTT